MEWKGVVGVIKVNVNTFVECLLTYCQLLIILSVLIVEVQRKTDFLMRMARDKENFMPFIDTHTVNVPSLS